MLNQVDPPEGNVPFDTSENATIQAVASDIGTIPAAESSGIVGPLSALEAERDALAAIVEDSRDAIWSWSTDGIITRWNAEAARLFGYRKEEVVGQSLLCLVPHDRRDRARRAIRQIKEGGSFGQHETERLHRDGTRIPVELTVSPIRDKHGGVIGAATVCRDIRERKLTQSALAKRIDELTTLYHLTERLQSARDAQEIYAAALQAISDALGCKRASILLYDAAQTMRFVAWSGLSDEYRKLVEGHSPWSPDTKNPTAIFVEDIQLADESEQIKAAIASEGIRALAFIPLLANDRLIGKFMLYHPVPHAFSQHENILANTIARQLALAVSRQKSEEALRHSEERFRLMTEHAPVMIWMSDDRGRCLHLNKMLRTFWGISEDHVTTFDWSKTLHPDDVTRVQAQMSSALQRMASASLKARYANGSGQYRVLQTDARPRISPNGQFIGMIGVNVDITEREEAERSRDLVVAELNHRVKNTLSIVQAIAHQTFRNASSTIEARKAFEGRLTALSAAHNLLTKTNWENVSLQEVARLTLGASSTYESRILIEGPSVSLPPKEAVSLAMALHELCTNAVKHGSLSNDQGIVTLSWSRLSSDSTLEIQWKESGGPLATPPTRRGFGSLLLERTLAQDLGGEVTIEFRAEGLCCSIRAPLREGG